MTGESICLWCGDIIASDHSQVDFCVKCHENLRDMETEINGDKPDYHATTTGYFPLYSLTKDFLKKKRGVT